MKYRPLNHNQWITKMPEFQKSSKKSSKLKTKSTIVNKRIKKSHSNPTLLSIGTRYKIMIAGSLIVTMKAKKIRKTHRMLRLSLMLKFCDLFHLKNYRSSGNSCIREKLWIRTKATYCQKSTKRKVTANIPKISNQSIWINN